MDHAAGHPAVAIDERVDLSDRAWAIAACAAALDRREAGYDLAQGVGRAQAADSDPAMATSMTGGAGHLSRVVPTVGAVGDFTPSPDDCREIATHRRCIWSI